LKSELKGSEITLYKSFDEKINIYNGDFSVSSIEKFVETFSVATIMDFD